MNAIATQQRIVADVPLSNIHNTDFQNTRRRIESEALESLKASISEVGLLQPLVVTPRETGEGYTLIAGFTRYQALQELNIPTVNVTVVTGSAHQIAESHAAENFNRSDLSITSQIGAIRRLATKLGGDYTEVAKRLNLTKKQLDDRLALSLCSPAVLDALDAGSIKLGHCAILSSFTHAVQDKSLAKIQIEGWTVETLRERAGKAKIKLELGKFDKAACVGCEHNSDTLGQSSLFEEEVTAGICSNTTCFGAKQQAWLDNKKEEVQGDYGTLLEVSKTDVSLIRFVDTAKLGETQFTACQQCPSNCAMIDDRLISTAIGSVRTNICNDASCYDPKSEAFLNPPKPESTSDSQASTNKGTTSTAPASEKAEKTFDLATAKMGNSRAKPLISCSLSTCARASHSPERSN